MYYDKFMKSCGFWMRRYKRTVTIFSWSLLIMEMVYEGKLTIWKQLTMQDMQRDTNECLTTSSTPKLRKMLRSNPEKEG